ncbi:MULTISPECIES: ABC transporter ATP-binding protein [Alphaproteobacteria]|uniref:ABC transporter ATP-binding protein n=2 Tax=Alphaproteobacteria TaxID=28211 RepID=A0A512HCB3_9HYPH|nr:MULTISPECIES: ABC transporter ATP-binding protein [Alphaproteobacteria]GEO83082.1 ABC transporter ATP-binding protein [Ciceribacter naphthalenivorans]GLR20523.1 ABC transporter ATP-binding protein [Ciceribacter naphthalenivorans]GLT03379.1 ABC transporter ATP-binding protein [Sphingomonas psychrolutea]
MAPIISVNSLSKTYANGFKALDNVSLDIEEGEILALLGPNGAGKTTLISIICGIANPSEGSVTVDGHDVVRDFRKTRGVIGLVPQELTTDQFESVVNTVSFSRGLNGKKPNPAYIDGLLRELTLYEKRSNALRELSGGMKRRVLIAKALSHEPRILFLDEPTAGVDVSLRKDMWQLVKRLREGGVTIILTTHYIEEAQEIADRIGIIDRGKLMLVEDKNTLMRKLGGKQLIIELREPLAEVPSALGVWKLTLSQGGRQLVYEYDEESDHGGIAQLLAEVEAAGIVFADIATRQTSLEDIFVSLIGEGR